MVKEYFLIIYFHICAGLSIFAHHNIYVFHAWSSLNPNDVDTLLQGKLRQRNTQGKSSL